MDMKQNIKIFLIALVLGMGIAFLISFKFKEPIALAINRKATYFYVGSYNSLETANTKKANYKNSLIYQDGNIYKVVIGIYYDDEVVELMSSYYNDLGISFYQGKLEVNSDFLYNIKDLELLFKASNYDYYENVNESILNLFDEYLKENI